MFRTTVCLALFIVGSAGSFSFAAPAKPTFETVVKAHFESWTKGKLTREHVNELINRKDIEGDEAVALATIHLQFRDNPKLPSLTLAEILATAAAEGTAEERRDQAAKNPHFIRNFNRFRNHLASVPHQIFADEGPQRLGMHQGYIGDCYIIAAIGAAVSRNSDDVRSLIRRLPDGKCYVVLPGAGRVRVADLTDAQVVLGATAGKQGIWLNVLEEAFSKVTKARSRMGGTASATNSTATVELDAINEGGDSARIMEMMTGHVSKTIAIRKDGNDPNAPVGPDFGKKVLELRRVFAASIGTKLVCCGVGVKGDYPPGIITRHAYAVIGFDAKTNFVTVWNPWGHNFTPKGSPGMVNGFKITNGEFKMPLALFVKVFRSIAVETNEPLKKKTK